MRIINKNNDGSIDLDTYMNLTESQKKLCEALDHKIEQTRSDLMQRPDAFHDGLLGKFNHFKSMSWDEILSREFEIINEVAEDKKISRVEVLDCILLLNPPRWREFFWRLQYEKMTVEIWRLAFSHLPLKSDSPEILAAKRKEQIEIRQRYYKEGERITRASGGLKKVENDKDGKQKSKELVKSDWRAWQARPTDYESKAAFARDMLEHYPTLTSQKVIEDWCRNWEKELTK